MEEKEVILTCDDMIAKAQAECDHIASDLYTTMEWLREMLDTAIEELEHRRGEWRWDFQLIRKTYVRMEQAYTKLQYAQYVLNMMQQAAKDAAMRAKKEGE